MTFSLNVKLYGHEDWAVSWENLDNYARWGRENLGGVSESSDSAILRISKYLIILMAT
jgi:hypothetical protein